MNARSIWRGPSAPLALTLMLNGAALVGMIAWNPSIIREAAGAIRIIDLEPIPTPPPIPEKLRKTPPKPVTRPLDRPDSSNSTSADTEIHVVPLPPIVTDLPGLGPVSDTPPDIVPPRDPVRRGAQLDPRYAADRQPPYPPGLQRLEIEGSARVNVRVGPDGRPIEIVLVSATDPQFFAATQRWGMKHWRFTPATEDGKPVEGWRTLTITFTID